jgi:hypothetical protein
MLAWPGVRNLPRIMATGIRIGAALAALAFFGGGCSAVLGIDDIPPPSGDGGAFDEADSAQPADASKAEVDAHDGGAPRTMVDAAIDASADAATPTDAFVVMDVVPIIDAWSIDASDGAVRVDANMPFDACLPKTCASIGATCGTINNGCGEILACGSCAAPYTCGGGGVPNHCGCSPIITCPAGYECGTVSDGCGGVVSCGTCAAPATCGGGGVANQCGTMPVTVDAGPPPSCYVATSFIPQYVPPKPFHANVCTSADISQIYTDCFVGSACANDQTLLPACYSCIFSSQTDAEWGAVLQFGFGENEVNIGGCIANAVGGSMSCGESNEAQEQCEVAHCSSCEDFITPDYESCMAYVDLTVCASYADAANSCNAAIATSSQAYECLSPTTFQQYFTQMATLFCGP